MQLLVKVRHFAQICSLLVLESVLFLNPVVMTIVAKLEATSLFSLTFCLLLDHQHLILDVLLVPYDRVLNMFLL